MCLDNNYNAGWRGPLSQASPPCAFCIRCRGERSEEISRKVKSKVAPSYPELARRMAISGVVKVQVVVAPNGSVKSTKVVGGHPLLVNAAVDALKKWRFDAASEETTGVVEFKFDPNVATQ